MLFAFSTGCIKNHSKTIKSAPCYKSDKTDDQIGLKIGLHVFCCLFHQNIPFRGGLVIFPLHIYFKADRAIGLAYFINCLTTEILCCSPLLHFHNAEMFCNLTDTVLITSLFIRVAERHDKILSLIFRLVSESVTIFNGFLHYSLIISSVV